MMRIFTVFAVFLCIAVGAGAVCTGTGQASIRTRSDAESTEPDDHASSQRSTSPDNRKDADKRGTRAITGRLVDESGQPIPHAAVYLRKAGPPSGPTRSIGTNEDGRFQADDLGSGAYMVSAFAPGYVPAIEPVEREYHRPGDVVNLRMTKGGIITGTVTNSFGEPVVGVRVSTIRVRDGESRPIRGASQSGISRQTDDRGVYRTYGLHPGTYLVLASGTGQMSSSGSAYASDVPTYYPSTTRDAAGEIVIRSGQEVSGIDIRYRGDRGSIVSGTLSGALGDGSLLRGVSVSLTRKSSGAIESREYVQPRAERGFALNGIPDGEYELTAQMDVGAETSAASPPRQVTVKGADVTGIELALAPLGLVSGGVIVERLRAGERPPDCRAKRTASLDELVLMARLDEKSGAKEQASGPGIAGPNDASPDDKGDFKIPSLAAGRYRIEMRLPTDDWFVKAMTRAGTPASTQIDVAAAGLGIGARQRVTDLTIALAEGAAGLRGKVISASEGARLPAHLQVHAVPAEPESADDAARFSEVRVDSEGGFSISNLAPGRYYLIVQTIPEDQLMERRAQPLGWASASRAKLRRDAQKANVLIELQRCQRVTDFVLKHSAPTPRTAPSKQ